MILLTQVKTCSAASPIFPPHDVPSVLIHLFFCTDSLSFWEGPGEEGMHMLGCANGSLVYLPPKSRGCLHSAQACTHSSVLLDSKLERLTPVELHKGHWGGSGRAARVRRKHQLPWLLLAKMDMCQPLHISGSSMLTIRFGRWDAARSEAGTWILFNFLRNKPITSSEVDNRLTGCLN